MRRIGLCVRSDGIEISVHPPIVHACSDRIDTGEHSIDELGHERFGVLFLSNKVLEELVLLAVLAPNSESTKHSTVIAKSGDARLWCTSMNMGREHSRRER